MVIFLHKVVKIKSWKSGNEVVEIHMYGLFQFRPRIQAKVVIPMSSKRMLGGYLEMIAVVAQAPDSRIRLDRPPDQTELKWNQPAHSITVSHCI